MKGKVSKCDHREYGFASVDIQKLGSNSAADALFEGLGDSLEVWMRLYSQFNNDRRPRSLCHPRHARYGPRLVMPSFGEELVGVRRPAARRTDAKMQRTSRRFCAGLACTLSKQKARLEGSDCASRMYTVQVMRGALGPASSVFAGGVYRLQL